MFRFTVRIRDGRGFDLFYDAFAEDGQRPQEGKDYQKVKQASINMLIR